jgi:hypothetical protein
MAGRPQFCLSEPPLCSFRPGMAPVGPTSPWPWLPVRTAPREVDGLAAPDFAAFRPVGRDTCNWLQVSCERVVRGVPPISTASMVATARGSALSHDTRMPQQVCADASPSLACPYVQPVRVATFSTKTPSAVLISHPVGSSLGDRSVLVPGGDPFPLQVSRFRITDRGLCNRLTS